MSDRQSVGANATVVNAMVGKNFEYLQGPSRVRFYGTASAVGLNMTLQIGARTFMQDQEVSANNRMPIVPDDYLVDGAGVAGQRVTVSYRNTTGGAITAFTRVEIYQLRS